MGKNDFDIDFDFEEEYGFDPKAFLGTEEYDDKIDLNAFSDEDLGLTPPAKPEEQDSADDSFAMDEDLDLDDFLKMGDEEETEEDPAGEEVAWADEMEPEEDESVYEEEEEELFEEEAGEEYDMDPDLPEDTDPEETAMNETMEYEEEEVQERFEDEALADEEVYETEEQEQPKKQPRQRKERKPIQLPKLKTPNIFTKFYDLYFAPVVTKDWQNEPAPDPNNPRRRRRKSKQQIFKEVYLPPILACVCLILVMSFVIGSLSNFIKEKQIERKENEILQSESLDAAAQAEIENQRILAEAEALAAGYDYQSAIERLDSLGDLSGNQALQVKRAEYVNAMNALVEYQDPTMIPNLSFHVLIHDLSRAMADTDNLKGNYNRNFVSTAEFTKILEQLYANGYVLVDFDSFVNTSTDINGNKQFEAGSLWLPADKKPVMITETMVNYFDYMIGDDGDFVPDTKGDGFAHKLVLDANGDIKAEYMDAQGNTTVGNYDLVPILEDFIKQHPDFSYQGARAIVAMTGSEGVFGYRINSSITATKGNDYWEKECAGAKEIANALRDKGYTLACYTYNNDKYAGFSVAQIQADLTSWTSQVVSVIGQMDTFVFARMSNITDYTGSAFTVMYDSGFRYFISNADSPMTEVNPTYVRQNRLMVTGETMQHFSNRFTGMFDCAAILDVNTRGSVPTG